MSCNCLCFVCVHQTETAIVESCGVFNHALPAGCHIIQWPVHNIVGRINLRVQQIVIDVNTKTKDNVFCDLQIAVQYRVVAEDVWNAFYRLTDPYSQIRAYVNDVIRGEFPKLELDEAFISKEHVAEAVRERLAVLMKQFGYEIKQALITSIEPDSKVKASMNEINAQTRLRVAAREKAEASKILAIKAAEAEAESKYLSGVGVARQRKALMDGMRESITSSSSNVEGTRPSDVMDLLLLTQYFDMLRDTGLNKNQPTSMFLSHNPSTVKSLKASLYSQQTAAAAAQAAQVAAAASAGR